MPVSESLTNSVAPTSSQTVPGSNYVLPYRIHLALLSQRGIYFPSVNPSEQSTEHGLGGRKIFYFAGLFSYNSGLILNVCIKS